MIHILKLFALVTLCLLSSAYAVKTRYSLDAHVHHNFEAMGDSESGHEQFIASDMFQYGILISRSYSISNQNTVAAGYEWASDETSIAAVDKAVSDFSEQHGGRFAGACGLNLQWENPLQHLRYCLALPHMKGIKLRTDADNAAAIQITNSQAAQKLTQVLEEFKDDQIFIIWHVDTSGSELSQAYELAKRYSNIQFVFAHSLYSVDSINRWIAKEQQDGVVLQNVFLEISTFFYNGPGELRGDAVAAWKEFGISRILFGSDSSKDYILAVREHRLLTQAVLRNGVLDQDEKEAILNTNGLTFLEKIGFID